MSYRIFRHPEVENDLFDIVDLIAAYAGVDIAERKIAEIEKTINTLANTPHMGSFRHEIYPNLRAIPSARKAVISFIVDDEEKSIFIVSITYAGADWQSYMQKRI